MNISEKIVRFKYRVRRRLQSFFAAMSYRFDLWSNLAGKDLVDPDAPPPVKEEYEPEAKVISRRILNPPELNVVGSTLVIGYVEFVVIIDPGLGQVELQGNSVTAQFEVSVADKKLWLGSDTDYVPVSRQIDPPGKIPLVTLAVYDQAFQGYRIVCEDICVQISRKRRHVKVSGAAIKAKFKGQTQILGPYEPVPKWMVALTEQPADKPNTPPEPAPAKTGTPQPTVH